MKLIIPRTHRRFTSWLALVAIDGVFFGLTDVKTVPSLMLAVGFILLTVTIYYVVYGLLSIVQLVGVLLRHKQRLSVALTVLIGCVVAFRSSGELNVRDIIVLLPIVIIGYAYSFYGKAVPQTSDL